MRSWLMLVLLGLVPCISAGKAKAKDAFENRRKPGSLAAALTAASDEFQPVCKVSGYVEAFSMDPECPLGTTADEYTHQCYQDCSVFNTAAVKYVASSQGDYCIPTCPAGTIKLTATGSSVTCITCPQGYTGIPGKGCWSSCSGDFPEQWNQASRPVCAQRCSFTAPKAVDANTCTNYAQTKWLKRSTRSRIWTMPAKSQKLAVKAKLMVDAECPEGSTMYSFFHEEHPEEAHPHCYSCPDGYETRMHEDGNWVYCTPVGCPDGYNRCGDYCWSYLLPLEYLAEEDCAAFLGVFSCLPSCSSAQEEEWRKK